METFGDLLKSLLDVWKEMWGAAWPMIKTAVSFSLWVLIAIIILPCVYISTVIYPAWEKWGEKF